MKRVMFLACAAMLAAHAAVRAQVSTDEGSSRAPSNASAIRPHAKRPVIAIVADSAGTELTDFMIPRATLTESGVANVITVAAHAGRIRLVPGTISIDPDLTFAAFDAANPGGADYVIVPALVDHESPAIAAWLRAQAARGATIVSICEGARVLAHAGILDGRSATSHWHALAGLAEQYPHTTWVRNKRYVVDDRVISTTGVSASLPASIYLVERIAGPAVADSVARRIGVASWEPTHDTDAFHIRRSMYVHGMWDYVAWWRHDRIAIGLADGFDEIALALSVDAIARTIRGKPFTWSNDGTPVRGRQGMRIAVDQARPAVGDASRAMVLPSPGAPPAGALDAAIAQLASWYGSDKAELIEMGMEYPPVRRNP